VARGERLYALYAVAIGVGLRRSEALGLSWEDVDPMAGTVRVRSTLHRVGGRLQLLPPKTRQSRRTVRLPDVCMAALVEHKKRQDAERELAGSLWREHGLVFTTRFGTPVEPTNVNRWFRELCERAGLPKVRLHDLRHTCASLLLAQGVAPRVVMEILGHSAIALTMNTYSHVLPVLEREAADRMNDLLEPRG
jgi:integrase